MAKFRTDFSEYTIDQFPNDWTERRLPGSEQWLVVSDTNIVGGQALKVSAADVLSQLTWDDCGSGTDVELLALAYYPGDAFQNYFFIRQSNEGTSTSNYAALFNSDNVRVQKSVEGGVTELAASATTVSSGNWYWVRWRSESVGLYLRVWEDGTNEPGTWTWTSSDASLTGGRVGVGFYTVSGEKLFDFFSAAMAGETADSIAQTIISRTLSQDAETFDTTERYLAAVRKLLGNADTSTALVRTIGAILERTLSSSISTSGSLSRVLLLSRTLSSDADTQDSLARLTEIWRLLSDVADVDESLSRTIQEYQIGYLVSAIITSLSGGPDIEVDIDEV